MPFLNEIPQTIVIYIVIAILSALFFAQQFGTASIGKMFGPIMLIWFTYAFYFRNNTYFC